MKASDVLLKRLDEAKYNVKVGLDCDDDREIVCSDLDFVKWLIQQLDGDLNQDIDEEKIYDTYLHTIN